MEQNYVSFKEVFPDEGPMSHERVLKILREARKCVSDLHSRYAEAKSQKRLSKHMKYFDAKSRADRCLKVLKAELRNKEAVLAAFEHEAFRDDDNIFDDLGNRNGEYGVRLIDLWNEIVMPYSVTEKHIL